MIKLKDLLAAYREYMSEKDEKVKITTSVFKKRVIKHMPEFKERYAPTINGNRKNIKSVFLNCRFIDDDYENDKSCMFGI